MYHDSFKDAPDRIQNWKGKLQMFEKNPEMLWDLMSRYQIFSSKFPETYFYNDKKVIEFSNSKACGSFNSLFDKIREKTTNQKLLVMIEKCFTRLWENKIIFAD